MGTRRVCAGLGVFILLGLLTMLLHAADVKPGDQVEVKVGGQWVSAKLVSLAGGRGRVQFADGKRDWATPDDIRPVGSATAGDTASPDSGTTMEPESATKPSTKRQFQKGQTLEWQSSRLSWEKVQIMAVYGELYLVAPVNLLDRDSWWKWVTAYSLREEGEKYPGLISEHQFKYDKGQDSIRKSQLIATNELADFKRKHGTDLSLFIDNPENQMRIRELELQQREEKDEALAKIDLAAARQVLPHEVAGPWQSLVDQAESFNPRSVLINIKLSNESESDTWLGNRAGDKFMMTVGGRHTHESHHVYLTNIRTGGLLKAFAFHPDTLPLAVSFDGKRVVARGNGRDKTDLQRVDLWDWTSSEPRHLLSFKLPDSNDKYRPNVEVKWADLAVDNLLLTTSSDGWLTCWEPDSARARWICPIGSDLKTDPIITPGGRKVIVHTKDKQLFIADIATGKIEAMLDGSGFGLDVLMLSYDGRFLLGMGNMLMRMWDLEDGKMYPTIWVGESYLAPKYCMLNDGMILSDGNVLNGRTGQLVWRYKASSNVHICDGLFVRYDPRKRIRVMDVWSLPHDDVTKATPRAPANALMLDPKLPVGISLDKFDTSDENRKKLYMVLAEKIREKGYTLATDTATQGLVGLTIAGEMVSVTYTESKSGAQHTVSYRNKVSTLAIVKDGQFALLIESDNAPSSWLMINDGESVQDVVDSSCLNNIWKFEQANLPEIILQKDVLPMGTSTLVRGGIQTE